MGLQVHHSTSVAKHGWSASGAKAQWSCPTEEASVGALYTHEMRGIHSLVHRLLNTFQGRLEIPLSDVKRQHHMKGEYRLEGVRQVSHKVVWGMCKAGKDVA